MSRISISQNRRHFVDQSGNPFFFLADTAWNGALKATDSEWDQYLSLRAEQGFTAVQFVPTHWRACEQPPHGSTYQEIDGKVVRNEAALQKMDERIQKIVDHGMIPVPVMLWLNNLEPFHQGEHAYMRQSVCNPLYSEKAMIEIGRDMLARWGKFSPIWFYGGDGDYRGREFGALMKRVGAAIFADSEDALVTIHPGGGFWPNDYYATESWYNIASIQSGHNEGADGFLTNGPYTYRWRDLKMPFINTEPYYERVLPDQSRCAFSVRRAAYWSILGAPIAGVTFGTASIWAWNREQNEQAENHSEEWISGPWTEWMESEGTRGLQILKQAIAALPWTELLPADQLLAEQPGFVDGANYIKVAAKPDESPVVAYSPGGDNVQLQLTREPAQAHWIDPRTGDKQEAAPDANAFILTYKKPDSQDWLLIVS